MKKMKTVFVMDHKLDLVTNKVEKENKWVLDGEGKATIKFDGTACLIKDGILFKRWNRKLTKKAQRQVKNAKVNNTPLNIDITFFKELPKGAIACNETFDPVTLHFPHWIPVGDGKEDAFHREGFENLKEVLDGTFELVGPKIQSNPHNFKEHTLLKHGELVVDIKNRTFEGIKEALKLHNFEGFVFHHEDGRKAKIRRKDFFNFFKLTNGRKVDWRNENVNF